MSGKERCWYSGCPNLIGDKVQFYRFPIDPELQLKWIAASGNDRLEKYSNKTRRRRCWICSEHFKESSFQLSFCSLKRRLVTDAVPKIFGKDENSSSDKETDSLPKTNQEILDDSSSDTLMISPGRLKKEIESEEARLPKYWSSDTVSISSTKLNQDSDNEALPVSDVWSSDTVSISPAKLRQEIENEAGLVSDGWSSDTVSISPAKLKQEIENEARRVSKPSSSNNAQVTTRSGTPIRLLKRKSKTLLKKKLKKRKLKTKRSFKLLDAQAAVKDLSPFLGEILTTIVTQKIALHRKKCPIYSMEMIHLATSLYLQFKSKHYKLLCTFLPLPSINTIKRNLKEPTT